MENFIELLEVTIIGLLVLFTSKLHKKVNELEKRLNNETKAD